MKYEMCCDRSALEISEEEKKIEVLFRVVIPGKILVKIHGTDLIRSGAPNHLKKCDTEKKFEEKTSVLKNS